MNVLNPPPAPVFRSARAALLASPGRADFVEGERGPSPPLSSALAEVIEAVQDSMSARLDVLRERVVQEAQAVALRSMLWLGAIISVAAAWLATVIAFTIWVSAATGPILAALWVALIHIVAGLGFFVAMRAHADEAGGPG